MKSITYFNAVLSACGLATCFTVFSLTAIVSASTADAPALPIWTINHVDTFSHNTYGNTSVAVDAAGKIHLSYVDNRELRYAILSGSTWITKVVDPGAQVFYQSLAVDVSGQPHVAYVALYPSATTGNLRYATISGTNWVTQTVDDSPFVEGWPSLAVDKSGRPRISYEVYGVSNPLRYAVLTSTGWLTQTISDGHGSRPVMDVDGSGAPHIMYSTLGTVFGGVLNYAVLSETTWITQTILGQCGVSVPCEPNALKLDNDKRPHILYRDDEVLYYGVLSGTQWTVLHGFSPIDRNYRASLAIDSSGVPHISYAGRYGQDLIYATQILSQWTSQTVDASLGAGSANSIALSDTDHMAIGYLNTYLDQVEVARVWQAVAWVYLPLIRK